MSGANSPNGVGCIYVRRTTKPEVYPAPGRFQVTVPDPTWPSKWTLIVAECHTKEIAELLVQALAAKAGLAP